MAISRRKMIILGGTGLLGAGMYASLGGGEIPDKKPLKLYIDIHRHILPLPYSLGKSIESQIESTLLWLGGHNVEQAIVQMAVNIGEGKQFDSAAVRKKLDLYRPHSPRLVPFFSIHPNTPHSHSDLVAIMTELKEQGVMGMGEFKIKGYAVDDPKCMAIYAACAEVRLPVLLHVDHKHCYDEPGLPHLENVLNNFPQHTFVGHAQGWWASISNDLEKQEDLGGRLETPVIPGGAIQRLMDSYKNLYGDLSANSGLNAVNRDPAYTLKFFKKYQDRLMFGTDTAPLIIPDWGHFEVYENLVLPESVEEKILRHNARKVFALPDVA